jgi:hypothetical protein
MNYKHLQITRCGLGAVVLVLLAIGYSRGTTFSVAYGVPGNPVTMEPDLYYNQNAAEGSGPWDQISTIFHAPVTTSDNREETGGPHLWRSGAGSGILWHHDSTGLLLSCACSRALFGRTGVPWPARLLAKASALNPTSSRKNPSPGPTLFSKTAVKRRGRLWRPSKSVFGLIGRI